MDQNDANLEEARGGVTYTLSPDRKQMRIIRRGPNGTLTTDITWDNPPSDDDIATALTFDPDIGGVQHSMRHYCRTWVTKRGRWFFHCNAGPPLWKLPHVYFEKWGATVGWFNWAITLAWTRTPK